MQIGIKTDPEVLKERIAKRFRKRVRAGIISEAKSLHKKGMSWKRMNEIGLAHKHIAKYLKEKNSSIDKPISKKEMIENSIREEQQYAKRQKTWFKRDKRIEWFKFEDKKNIEERVRLFL